MTYCHSLIYCSGRFAKFEDLIMLDFDIEFLDSGLGQGYLHEVLNKQMWDVCANMSTYIVHSSND